MFWWNTVTLVIKKVDGWEERNREGRRSNERRLNGGSRGEDQGVVGARNTGELE